MNAPSADLSSCDPAERMMSIFVGESWDKNATRDISNAAAIRDTTVMLGVLRPRSI